MGKPSRLRTISQLTARDWRTLVSATLLLAVIDAGLRIWGFRRVYSRLGAAPPRLTKYPLPSDADIAHLVRMVNIAANHGLVRVTCLRKSLAIWWLLRQRGVVSEIRIGVSREQGVFEAHAWVERDGVVLNDRSDIGQVFAVLASPESAAPSLQAEHELFARR